MTLPRRICDPHHHFWPREGMEYRPADLASDVALLDAELRTVFVECGAWYRDDGPQHVRVVGETEWVAAHADPLTEGIVGTADLRLGPAVDEVLHAHLDAAGGRFRGIRQMAAHDAGDGIRPIDPDPGPGLLLDDGFRRGLGVLHGLGLSFDAWIYFPQLPELADLARAFPDTPFVLNHLGGPIRLGPYADDPDADARWRASMAEVAACPNVALKVGGIGMPIYGRDFHRGDVRPTAEEFAAAWREPVRWSIETFGPERCMFESNFPVDRLSVDYDVLWSAFDLMTDDLSDTERGALFHDTAARVYRLDPGPEETP